MKWSLFSGLENRGINAAASAVHYNSQNSVLQVKLHYKIILVQTV